jgi:hypothetical protein
VRRTDDRGQRAEDGELSAGRRRWKAKAGTTDLEIRATRGGQNGLAAAGAAGKLGGDVAAAFSPV